MLKIFSEKAGKHILLRLWSLVFFLFAGIIVGENACEALVVVHLGYSVLPKLYIVNALSLFLLMPVVFLFIDRIERGKLLRNFIAASVLIVLTLFTALAAHPGSSSKGLFSPYSMTILLLYVFCYVSKIVMFVTFWTLSNDISTMRQSKQLFPLVASGGLAGGLVGSLSAKTLLIWVNTPSLLFLWGGFLILCIPFIQRIRKVHFVELQRSEFQRKAGEGSVFSISYFKPATKDHLIKVMAFIYFIIFIIVFNFDFQFAKALNTKFATPEQFADFKYKFYFAHSLVTMLFQWLVVGFIVNRFGIISSLAVLPVFFAAAFVVWLIGMESGASGLSFSSIVILQFLRQVLFESFFSPTYQVFFSSLKKEARGRSKVFLEGAVKPGAILFSGLLLYFLLGTESLLFSILLGLTLLFGGALVLLKKHYLSSLLAGIVGEGGQKEIARTMVVGSKEKMLSLLNSCFGSKDLDLKRVAVAGMGDFASKESFSCLISQFDNETEEMKEFIAKSMGRFNFQDNKRFLLSLCSNNNPRIVANALYSLRHSMFSREDDVVNAARSFFGLSETRISVEAALILWQLNDINIWTKIEKKINEWIESNDQNSQVAAIYLIGELQNVAWLPSIWKGLLSPQRSVWTKSIDVLGNFNYPDAWDILANYLLEAPREREDRIVRCLGRLPPSGWPAMQERFLSSSRRRSLFAIVDVLKRIALHNDFKIIELRVPVQRKLKELIMYELEIIYSEIYCLKGFTEKYTKKNVELLREAIAEKRKRLILFLFDMVALLDRTGQLLRTRIRSHEIDPKTQSQLLEMFDSVGEREVTAPLLRLMETSDINTLTNFGRKRWFLNGIIGSNYERYLLSSTNTWIRAVAIYTLRNSSLAARHLTKGFDEMVLEHLEDESPLVSNCAREYKEIFA